MAKPLGRPVHTPVRIRLRRQGLPAVKRALRHAGVYPGKGMPTLKFGPSAVRALKKFQRQAAVKKGVGSYTQPTHAALVKHKHFDAYGAHLMQWWPAARRRPATAAPSSRPACGRTRMHPATTPKT